MVKGTLLFKDIPKTFNFLREHTVKDLDLGPLIDPHETMTTPEPN